MGPRLLAAPCVHVPGGKADRDGGRHGYFSVVGLLLMLWSPAFSQKQLVFIQHGTVVARYTEGSRFKCILKNHQHKDGFIVELNDFSMITSEDTISFQSIAKLRRSGGPVNVRSGLGGLFFIGGLGYVAVDQINAALGYNPSGFDKGDVTALVIAGVGAAILFIKPRYQRVKPGTVIRTIDYRSPYFLSTEP